jgi:hypothetical protein
VDLAVTVAGAESSIPQVQMYANPPVGISTEEDEEKTLSIEAKTSGVGAAKNIRRKGRGKCPLPSMRNYAWEEAKTSGAWECWFTPKRTSERGGKTYIGYVGKKLLAEWLSQSEDKAELRQLVAAWIGEKEAAKGNLLTRVRPPQKPKNHREKRGEL